MNNYRRDFIRKAATITIGLGISGIAIYNNVKIDDIRAVKKRYAKFSKAG